MRCDNCGYPEMLEHKKNFHVCPECGYTWSREIFYNQKPFWMPINGEVIKCKFPGRGCKNCIVKCEENKIKCTK